MTLQPFKAIVNYMSDFFWPHQMPSGSVLKTGGRGMMSSIPSCSCRPNHSKFSVIFSETRLNTDYDLDNTLTEGTPRRPRFHIRKICLKPATQTKSFCVPL